MKILIIILSIISLVSCNSSKSQIDLKNCSILEFDGFSQEFYKKYNIYHSPDKEVSKEISLLAIQDDSIAYSSSSPVMWKIKVSDCNEKRLCDLVYLENGFYYFHKGSKYFKNQKLFDLLYQEMEVKKIEVFPNAVNQKIYNDFINNTSSLPTK